MAAKNPRISVVLTPSLASTLAAISHATGDSASSVVREILEQSEPALKRMLQLFLAAQEAKGQISGGVSGALTRVVSDLEDALAVAGSRLDRVERDLVDAAQEVKGRRRTAAGGAGRGAAAGVSTPGPVTRGSGPLGTKRAGGRKGGRHGTV